MENIPSAITTTDPIWPELRQERRAIVVVDVVESVRLMQANEADFIDRWRRFVNEVRTQVLPAHGGRLVKSLGDGLLLEFERVPSAVTAALEIQRRMERHNVGLAFDSAAYLRMGVHVAHVVVDDLDIYGTGVNLAARLAALEGPGQIVISADVRDELVPEIDANLEDLGDCFLKHVVEPVRCFKVAAPQPLILAPESVQFQGPSIAVIPFDTMQGAYGSALGEIVAEEIIHAISRNKRLQVISRLSTQSVALRGFSCREIGARLGAKYVLNGRADIAGDGMLVHAELSDAESDHIVWSTAVRGKVTSLLEPDDELLATIVSGTLDAVDQAEVERATHLPLPNLKSYTLMVGGVTLMHRTGASDFDRSRQILEFLVERSGRHPVPRAWLAKWHVLNVQQGWSSNPATDATTAIELARRAIDSDPSCSLAHTMEGFARANVLRQFDEALACYQTALDLNPNDSLAWLLSGVLRAFQGDGAQAVAACERAQRLSPLDPLRYFYDALHASAALTAGHYERAIALARRSLQLNRSHLSTHRALTAALSLAGRVDEARVSAKELLAREPGFTVSQFLARTPGQEFDISRRIAQAFRDAGIPA